MINDCHRISINHNNTSPRRIIVNFSNHQVNVDFLKARQIFRNFCSKYIDIQPDVPIYIRENLTINGNTLFKEARDLKIQLNFQFVWTKNAIIFLRKNETEKIMRVDSEDTIQNIKGQYEDLNS
uniref:FP protein C-terminal domain-containing protein n=1 Tax=Sipha flava TaxID=143950 RepID=A0A2S2Q334_9HEMI